MASSCLHEDIITTLKNLRKDNKTKKINQCLFNCDIITYLPGIFTLAEFIPETNYPSQTDNRSVSSINSVLKDELNYGAKFV